MDDEKEMKDLVGNIMGVVTGKSGASKMPTKEKCEESMDDLKKLFPYLVEHIYFNAKLRHEKYKALTKEGFQPAQAIAIIIGTPIYE
jgi:hypothetical protein